MKPIFNGSREIKFKNATRLRKGMTMPEGTLWSQLAQRQITNLRFGKQYAIAVYTDFYYQKASLVIEADGEIHQQKRQIVYDVKRTAVLEAEAFKVLRFTNNQYFVH